MIKTDGFLDDLSRDEIAPMSGVPGSSLGLTLGLEDEEIKVPFYAHSCLLIFPFLS